MRPFYLTITAHDCGTVGHGDMMFTLDDAADDYAEVEKLDPKGRKVVLIDPRKGDITDVTRRIEAHIAARMNGRSAA